MDKLLLVNADGQTRRAGSTDKSEIELTTTPRISTVLPSCTQQPYDIFISFRFAEAETEANALKAALEARGYKTFVSNETPGSDLQEAIAIAIGQSRLQVLLATKTYGKKTNQQYSTYQEMNYAVNHSPFLIRMPWDVVWLEPATNLALDGRMWEPWTPGEPVPDGLVDKIIDKTDGTGTQAQV